MAVASAQSAENVPLIIDQSCDRPAAGFVRAQSPNPAADAGLDCMRHAQIGGGRGKGRIGGVTCDDYDVS